MENKTFFGIEVNENITLMANNPYEALQYLYEMHSAFFELSNYYGKAGFNNLKDEARGYMHEISRAIDTITEHMKED